MISEAWRTALINHLQHDHNLATLLGRYDGRPAIFGFSPVPEATLGVFVVVPGLDLASPLQDKSRQRWELIHTVEVWVEGRQNQVLVDRAADYISLALDRAKILVALGTITVHQIIAEPPIDIEDDDYSGRAVTLTVVIHRGD